jgi:glycosyltransferase involved in cell wall biosynthesis
MRLRGSTPDERDHVTENHLRAAGGGPLRVLVASKFWYQRGGLERVMFDEIAGLEAAGHAVAGFSTTHPDNVPSPWSEYFAPYLELGAGSALPLADKVRAVARMFSNRPAASAFDRLLADFRPDVVHVHGIHRQLSPSILFVAKRRRIPVVQTLHDYHHACPAAVLLRGGSVPCDPPLCGPLNTLPCVTARCVRGDATISVISAAETSWQRARRAYERTVDRFISPSHYLSTVMRQAGWTLPIDVVPNGVDSARVGERQDEGFFLVASRLSPEKGVSFAARAAMEAGVPLVVLGDGPERERLLADFPALDLRGHVTADEVQRQLLRCRAAVMPSTAIENAPMSILEALSLGVPVISSSVGGVPEQVRDGREGLLVPAGDIDALAAAMRRLAGDPALASRMGHDARQRAREAFGFDRHMRGLVAVYERALRRGDSHEGAAEGGDSR